MDASRRRLSISRCSRQIRAQFLLQRGTDFASTCVSRIKGHSTSSTLHTLSLVCSWLDGPDSGSTPPLTQFATSPSIHRYPNSPWLFFPLVLAEPRQCLICVPRNRPYLTGPRTSVTGAGNVSKTLHERCFTLCSSVVRLMGDRSSGGPLSRWSIVNPALCFSFE